MKSELVENESGEDKEATPEFMRDHIELLHNMILGHMKNNGLTEWVVEPPEGKIEFTGYLTFIRRNRKDGYVDLVANMEPIEHGVH